MKEKELANRINIDPSTLSEWKHTRSELYKLLHIGVKVEANLIKYKESLSEQKEQFKMQDSSVDYEKKRLNKAALARRLDVDKKTIFNWEKTKPDLLKLACLGIVAQKQLEETEIFTKKSEDIINSDDVELLSFISL